MVSGNDQYAIETYSLTKIFPDWWGRAKVVAVDNLELHIKRNEVYGLLGPNGSGKTTTLKMLLSLLHPTKGHALVLGGYSSDPKISAKIGYLPEDSYLYKYLSARETLAFYGHLFGLKGKLLKSRIEALLEMVGLTGMSNRSVGTYSKGMARRIGLAQAMINDPEVLILDEPTSGMDPIGTRQMKDLFVELSRRGKTILLCSHLLADVEDVCDRIGILYGGRMQEEGSVESLLKHSEQKQIVTSGISEDALGRIQAIVRQENGDCSISSPMEKLEDFFIRTVASAQEQDQPTSGALNVVGLETGSEQKRTSDILDKLVSASVEESAAPDVIDSVQTETPSGVGIEDGQDNALLEKLTTASVEFSETEIVQSDETAAVTPVEREEVKRDVLDDLLSNADDEKGSPEQSGEGQTGDGEDA